ncbi:MAG: ABC transporter permease [Chitinophagaceae bacterium]
MIRNYFITACRNLLRNKVFSLINLSGLALGLTCSLLILLWIKDERSVDGFHANGQQLFNVYEREYAEGEVGATYSTPALLAEEMKKVLPEVEYASSYFLDQNIFRVGDKIFKQQGAWVSNDFLKMFSFPLLQGDINNALQDPANIAISRKMAVLLFGSPAEAIGKTVQYSNKENLVVTAVFNDIPANSSLQFDYLHNWQQFLHLHPAEAKWSSQISQTFIQLRKNANAVLFGPSITKFLDKYYTTQGPGLRKELGIQRFDERYLRSKFSNGVPTEGRIEYVKLFSLVAIFILLIACINFMNLSTVRAAKRTKEIGVRKVVGAERGTLILQFIGEAMLLVFFSIILSLVLVQMLLPLFNHITGKQIVLPVARPVFWLQLTGLGLITGFIAGSYPALVLSSLRPVKALKGVLRFSNSSVSFRKGLVVFQFVLSILLITGTIVISKQVNFLQTRNLGYTKENLVTIPIEGDLDRQYAVLKQKALQQSGIKSMSLMTGSPTGIGNYQDSIIWEGKDPSYRPTMAIVFVGYDFIKTMGIRLLQGRDFSPAYGDRGNSFLVNETAAQRFGFKSPLGQTLRLEGGEQGPIVGVVKDFHLSSLHDQVEPLIINLSEKGWGTIVVRTEAGKTQQALTLLGSLCKELNHAFPFTYHFADKEYEALYKSEQMIGTLSKAFAFLAILISCLGLLGLAMFTASQRTKEIGIRKVLGASVARVFVLLSGEFLKLVLAAFVIAVPFSWWLVHQWLDNYAYRTELSWWIFAAAGIVALLIALLTVSAQAIKAATANPVKSLKTE